MNPNILGKFLHLKSNLDQSYSHYRFTKFLGGSKPERTKTNRLLCKYKLAWLRFAAFSNWMLMCGMLHVSHYKTGGGAVPVVLLHKISVTLEFNSRVNFKSSKQQFGVKFVLGCTLLFRQFMHKNLTYFSIFYVAIIPTLLTKHGNRTQ